MASTTSGPVPGPYSISNLLRGEEHSYESRVSDLLSQRSSITTPSGYGASDRLPDAALCRDLGVGSPTGGGNLVGAGVAAVAAAARPQLILERAGAVRVEVNSVGGISLPIWQPDNGSAWLSEGATAPSLTTTVKSIECSGRMAAARLGMSRRMAKMSADIEAAVLAEISASVAGTIEKGFISGTGSSNQPLGVLNTPGVGTQSFASATPTWAELMSMIETAADADADLNRCAYLLHPSDLADLLKAESFVGAGAIVTHDGSRHRIAGFPVFTTTHQTEGKVFFMDASTIRTVYWGPPTAIVDKYSNGKSISGAIEIVVLNLCDIAIIQPAHIVVGSN